MVNNPHRFAGFKVLRAPDVPSVLLELGYLSNAEDEAQLRDPEWRRMAIASILDAIATVRRAARSVRRRLIGRTRRACVASGQQFASHLNSSAQRTCAFCPNLPTSARHSVDDFGEQPDAGEDVARSIRRACTLVTTGVGMIRLIGYFFGIGVTLALVVAAGIAIYIGSVSKDLPDYEVLARYEPPVTTRVHASDGELMGEFARERRLYLPIQAIPDRVKAAFLSAEDKNFYHHPGIDLAEPRARGRRPTCRTSAPAAARSARRRSPSRWQRTSCSIPARPTTARSAR